ncbi:DNA-processing protein DprA [Vulcaniibacterium thermophilum]|uniref:DNA processing protein DprA n=2 Tax=Vulcaniibacterium thermophilum TaxID=1169913 RepID=A0A918Z9X9_9GAMM|nr:DNA-processing protein DprA [Vulcaniibacterium thermophilum]GHE40191.1 DNA processing protein DprA [Vulcaniibacterium thermophilum]
MHPDDDIDALLTLAAAGGPGAPRRALLERHGAPRAALAAGPGAWREAGLNVTQIEALRTPDRAAVARALRWLEAPHHHLLGWHDPDYPPLLRRAPHPPLALFVAGDAARLWHPAVAVVGSRSPTAGGLDNAYDFTRALAASGLCVASGLAAGVDTAAHRAALDAQAPTVAVLGTGPDVAYPRANAGLLARIAGDDGAPPAGAVVSEHLPGTAARREHFPARNRILAGLTLGTLVIEAAERSGALITARQAAEAGREVFAVPGSIHNPLARGCHRLIREGAALVESATEVIDALGPLAAELAGDLRHRLAAPIHATAGPPGPAAEPLDPDYEKLWQALGHDPIPMDRLVERTGLTPAVLSSMLLLMELDGRVAVEHGRYCRVR